jgi:hypothetical protein
LKEKRIKGQGTSTWKGDVGGADIVGGEDGEKGNSVGGRFDVDTATLLAVDEAENSRDVHAGSTGGFNGRDGGAASGADVVDDDDVGSELEEAFDAPAGAMGLLGFADEEAMDEGGSGTGVFVTEFEGAREFEDLGVVGEGPGAGAGSVRDEGVGSHGEAANGLGVGDVLTDEIVEDETGEAAAFGVERGGAAVDVVVGLLAAGEGKVAQLERVGSDKVEQGGSGFDWHGLASHSKRHRGFHSLLVLRD